MAIFNSYVYIYMNLPEGNGSGGRCDPLSFLVPSTASRRCLRFWPSRHGQRALEVAAGCVKMSPDLFWKWMKKNISFRARRIDLFEHIVMCFFTIRSLRQSGRIVLRILSSAQPTCNYEDHGESPFCSQRTGGWQMTFLLPAMGSWIKWWVFTAVNQNHQEWKQ